MNSMNGNYFWNDEDDAYLAAASVVGRTRYLLGAMGQLGTAQSKAVNAAVLQAITRYQEAALTIAASGLPDEQREMAEVVNHNTFAAQMRQLGALDGAFGQVLERAFLQIHHSDEAWSRPVLEAQDRSQHRLGERQVPGPAGVVIDDAPVRVPRAEYEAMQEALAIPAFWRGDEQDRLHAQAKRLGIQPDGRKIAWWKR